jgi:UDP-2,3-diacylglucosamine pyrophosphatase LpxH
MSIEVIRINNYATLIILGDLFYTLSIINSRIKFYSLVSEIIQILKAMSTYISYSHCYFKHIFIICTTAPGLIDTN